MRAMVLETPGQPLRERALPQPVPGPGDLLIRVGACAVCRTDLHLVDGDLPEATLPRIPGHEIVGTVAALGSSVTGWAAGDRVGVPWLGWTCGECPDCLAGRENLCDRARFTGCQIDGGFAEYAVANARYCLRIPDRYDDAHAAPLLCAGLIGYRAWAATGEAPRLGLYGFGAAAHLMCQLARHHGQEVYAFTRPGDVDAQRFSLELGASWAGGSDQRAPVGLDAAILFAPVGALVPAALEAVRKGGTVVCAGIHMSEIPAFPYRLLWGERTVRSVANLTRADGERFLALAPTVPIRTEVVPYPLAEANRALDDLRAGRVRGAAVLVPEAVAARIGNPPTATR